MKIHMDLDCFFVSAERTRYPFLKNRPVVVVKGTDKIIFTSKKKQGVLFHYDMGAFNNSFQLQSEYSSSILNHWREEFIDNKTKEIHGIVIAKSYEAKKYNIKTGTALKDAIHMCPGLLILPSDHLFYQTISFKLKNYLETQIPLLEQYSIDEFFGDLNGWVIKENTLEFIKTLQDNILKKFDLPISIAASKSKWIAKLATDTIKPYGCRIILDEEIQSFTDPINIEDFPGIGRAIESKLKSYGIDTLKDAKRTPSLFFSYGKNGKDLYKRILGIDNEPVVPSRTRKGIGISRNFPAIGNREEINRRIMILSRYLSYTISKLKLNPITFYMKIRYKYGYKSKKSITINRVFNENFFINFSLELFKELDIYPSYQIHFLAISANNFVNKTNPKTPNLLYIKQDLKNLQLTQGLTKIRDKYGVDMIKYGKEALV